MAETVAKVPALLAWWDAKKNDHEAAEVPARSTRAYWWRCDRGHSFQRAPRVLGPTPACPTCALGKESLADSHPDLAKRWSKTKNAGTPRDVAATSSTPAWWVCAEGHTFERAPVAMIVDASCPYCALAHDSLAARFPEIAAEWHPHKNGDLTAQQIDADHMMTAWWLCSRGHEFRASVRSRTRSHGRCPECFGAWTVDTIRTFVRSLLGHVDALSPSEMFALAMQAGALRDRSSQAFVKALTTGRFPKEELEKFAEGKPSLVDSFAANRELTLEIVEAQRAKEKAAKPDDPYALPAGLNEVWHWIDGPLSIETLPGAGHFIQHERAREVIVRLQRWLATPY